MIVLKKNIHLSINSDLPECFITKRKSQMALKIELPSHCHTLRILFTSSYIVYVNLNRYFQATLASCQWAMSFLDHWQKLFIIQVPKTHHRVQHSPKNLQQKLQQGWTINLYHCIWFKSLHKGLSTRMEQSQKYKNHIIMIGTFHLIMAYFKMVGKKYRLLWF